MNFEVCIIRAVKILIISYLLFVCTIYMKNEYFPTSYANSYNHGDCEKFKKVHINDGICVGNNGNQAISDTVRVTVLGQGDRDLIFKYGILIGINGVD